MTLLHGCRYPNRTREVTQMIEDTMFDNDCYAVFLEKEHEKGEANEVAYGICNLRISHSDDSDV